MKEEREREVETKGGGVDKGRDAEGGGSKWREKFGGFYFVDVYKGRLFAVITRAELLCSSRFCWGSFFLINL